MPTKPVKEDAQAPLAPPGASSDGSEAILDFGFDALAKEVEKEIMPNGVYEFEVGPGSKFQKTEAGRPMIIWQILFTKHPKAAAIFYHTVFPWIPQGESKVDSGGGFAIVRLFQAIGRKWQGGKIQYSKLLESGIGGTFTSSIKTEEYEGRPKNKLGVLIIPKG